MILAACADERGLSSKYREPLKRLQRHASVHQIERLKAQIGHGCTIKGVKVPKYVRRCTISQTYSVSGCPEQDTNLDACCSIRPASVH